MGSYRIYFLVIVSIIGTTSGAVLECDTDDDCIEDASCLDDLCQCPDGYVFSTNGDQCLKHSIGYQSSCEDDTQCSWLMGKYYCNSGACDCDEGYRYFHGRCIESKGLGESCNSDEDCHVTNQYFGMLCSEGVCVCSEGYYARADYDCRKEANALSEVCALDMDCKVENSYCSNTGCASVTVARINATSSGFPNQQSISDIVTYAIGSGCTTSDDCEDVPNSMCSPLTRECVCRRGYFYSSPTGACVGEVGIDVGCTQNSECPITPRNCVDGACLCPDTHYHTDALSGCIRVPVSPTLICTSHTACHIISKDALCVQDGLQSFCNCPLGYQLNEETYLCEPMEDEDNNSECVIESHCSLINAVCVDRVCGCASDYRLEDDVCLPNLGAMCDLSTRLCEVEYADCTNSVCSCTEGYIILDDMTCLTVVNELYDSCEVDDQCSYTVANSFCSDERCRCIDTHIEKDGLCVEAKAYGQYCVNVNQCQVLLGENIQCRNSMCQCPADMERTNDGLDCRSRSVASTRRFFYTLTTILLYITYALS